MKKLCYDTAWIKGAIKAESLRVVVVIPDDKVLTVKSCTSPALDLRAGDILTKQEGVYVVTIKKGRTSVGEVNLSALTIDKDTAWELEHRAPEMGMSVPQLRRHIIHTYFGEERSAE